MQRLLMEIDHQQAYSEHYTIWGLGPWPPPAVYDSRAFLQESAVKFEIFGIYLLW